MEAKKAAKTKLLKQLSTSVQPKAFESLPQQMQDIISFFDQCGSARTA